MSGSHLVETLSQATGLPENLVTDELNKIITESGYSIEQLSVDELRIVMTRYLQKVILEAKQHLDV